MGTSLEHERKFLLNIFPEDFHTYDKSRLKQWYLTKPDNPVSIRVRLYEDGKCYFDIKKGFGITREKIGEKHEFDLIERYTKDAYVLEKDRYTKCFDDYKIVIDIFDDGLRIVEIESDNLDFIINFKPLDWFGEEVTYDDNYTNNALAYRFNKKE